MMIHCACGQLVEETETKCARCEALHVLGLEAEALDEEIRRAYRLLQKVWDPANFLADQKLKEAAEGKQKDITTAFLFLTSTVMEQDQIKRPGYSTSSIAPEPEPEPAPPQETPAPQEAPDQRPAMIARWSSLSRSRKLVTILAALLLLIATCAVLRSNGPASEEAAGGSRRVHRNILLKGLAAALNNIDPENATPEDSGFEAQPAAQLAEQNPAQAANQTLAHGAAQPAGKTSTQSGGRQPSAGSAARPAQPQGIRLKPYVTVGSTRDEAIALLGQPSAASDEKLVFGRSELYLKDNTVTGWRIDSVASPLRVKLWPQSAVDPDLDFFTLNSTKDEVLAVQGTPTAFSQNSFEYGASIVYFSNNRVVNWKNDPASEPLRVRR
jgi:hypothetical protein